MDQRTPQLEAKLDLTMEKLDHTSNRLDQILDLVHADRTKIEARLTKIETKQAIMLTGLSGTAAAVVTWILSKLGITTS